MESFSCPDTGDELWRRTEEASEPTSFATAVYTEGDCWRLAWALLEELPAAEDPQLVLFGCRWSEGRLLDWHHAAAVNGSGELFDVEGVRPLEDSNWGRPTVISAPSSLEEFKTMLRIDYEFQCRDAAANTVARLLVEDYYELR